MTRKTLIVAASCAGILCAVAPSSAIANVIHGCVDSASGSLRILKALSKCKKTESPISWNAVQGMNGVVYGTVHLIAGGGQPLPSAPAYTVTHMPGTGVYQIAFTPNPFTPAVPGPHGFDNAPTCLAASRRNPTDSICTANVAYDTGTGTWSATVNCERQGGTAVDADFAFACFQ